MSAPTIGRVVHVKLPNRQWRPALVVNTFGDLVNARVFLDLANDLDRHCGGTTSEELLAINFLRFDDGWQVMSAMEGDVPGCWRWPPRA